MSEYGKQVGFKGLECSENPRIEEIDALLSHVECQVERSTGDPGLIQELIRKVREHKPIPSGVNKFENRQSRDRRVFSAAREFLFRESPQEITEQIIQGYLDPGESEDAVFTLPRIYEKALEAAMNSNINAKVVGSVLTGNAGKLHDILLDFCPRKVFQKYNSREELLLGTFLQLIEDKEDINLTSKGPWPRFCKTVISAAEFFSQFEDGEDFFRWAGQFIGDFRAVPALPLLLGKEVYGMGFTLACDFLISIKLESYCIVDTTVKGLLVSAGLLDPGADGFKTLKAISRIAQHNDTNPYTVDKVFWLIGTGYFYNHLDLGKQKSGDRLKKQFIQEISNSSIDSI